MDGKAVAARLGGPVRLADARTGGASRDYRSSRAWMMPIPRFTPPRGHDMADQWPLHSFLELGPLPSAVPCARLHVRQLLWEWKLTDFSEAAELVVSELLTNAVQASRAMRFPAPVRIWLLSDTQRVLILVWDASPQPPVRMESRGDAENGRGLLLVETFSTQWNWYFPQESGGKVIWAEIEAESR
ncbi:MAG: ATP-binding protein [Streptosporangiaceae bacterium]